MDQLPLPGVNGDPPLWVCHARAGALLHLTTGGPHTICGETVSTVLALTKPRQAALDWRCRRCYRQASDALSRAERRGG